MLISYSKKKKMKTLRNILLFLVIYTNISLADSPYKWDLIDSTFSYYIEIENTDSLNLIFLENKFYAHKYLHRSTDAGITWDTIYKDPDRIEYGTDLAYPTEDFIIFTADPGLANDAGIYIRSTDGGKTWIETRTNHYDTVVGYRDVRMYDDKHGVISGGYNMIISHDGFETWDSVKLPERLSIICMDIVSQYSINLMAATASPFNQRFFRTSDGGLTWFEYSFPDPLPEFYAIRNMKFLDSLFGYVVGGAKVGQGATTSDRIFRTTDGGESWNLILDTLMPFPPRYGLTNLDILDKNNAIFVGMGGKIYWTHDGGDSFIHDPSTEIRDRSPNTLDVSMIGEHTAVIIDSYGRIFRSSLATKVEEEELPSIDDILITPNPARDYIELQINNHTLKGVVENVKVFDVLGMEVIKATTPSLRDTPPYEGGEIVRLDVSGLAPGVYFVQVGDKIFKFVKM